jgi:hypothetical protein
LCSPYPDSGLVIRRTLKTSDRLDAYHYLITLE